MTIYSLDMLLCQFRTSPCLVLTVASWPAFRFPRRQVRWSGVPISFIIFTVCVIHTVKGFGVVNEAEVDVFLELSCFFHDRADVGSLISGSSAFSKTSLNIRKFMVHVLLKPGLENFEHYNLLLLLFSCKVVPDSLRHLGLSPARLLCLWNSVLTAIFHVYLLADFLRGKGTKP